MKKLLTFLFAILFAAPCFATGVSGDSATCDSGTLSTDTGPTNLRANYESNTLNLKWHDENGTPITSNTCTYGGTITMPTAPTKRGYTFKGWKVITHTQIEYIESNGLSGAGIDTGVHGDNNNLRIVIDFNVYDFNPNLNQTYGEYAAVFANYVGEQHNTWRILLSDIGNRPMLHFYTNNIPTRSRNTYNNMSYNRRYLVDMDYNRFIVNGIQYNYSYISVGATKNNATIKLFNPFSSKDITTRIYSFKVYDNGTLVRDMIPVKDSDGVVCMYDEVSKQYFYNAGTGNFIAGPDL